MLVNRKYPNFKISRARKCSESLDPRVLTHITSFLKPLPQSIDLASSDYSIRKRWRQQQKNQLTSRAEVMHAMLTTRTDLEVWLAATRLEGLAQFLKSPNRMHPYTLLILILAHSGLSPLHVTRYPRHPRKTG